MVARSVNLYRMMDDTPANSENLDRTVEDIAANCLMLLSRVGECGGDGGESRVYRCKILYEDCSSFQALGGHCASHNKPINNSSYEQSSLSSGSVTKKKTKKMRLHRCPICGLEFPMEHALGGHMRKHRNEKEIE